MTAIAFTYRGIRTLVDGTGRVQLDIEPKDVPTFIGLFSIPGETGALARLTQEAAKDSLQGPKGGPLSKNAAALCRDEEFWAFSGMKTEEEATAYLRHYCGITSRRELDHNEEAARKYHQLKSEFLEWQHG